MENEKQNHKKDNFKNKLKMNSHWFSYTSGDYIVTHLFSAI